MTTSVQDRIRATRHILLPETTKNNDFQDSGEEATKDTDKKQMRRAL